MAAAGWKPSKNRGFYFGSAQDNPTNWEQNWKCQVKKESALKKKSERNTELRKQALFRPLVGEKEFLKQLAVLQGTNHDGSKKVQEAVAGRIEDAVVSAKEKRGTTTDSLQSRAQLDPLCTTKTVTGGAMDKKSPRKGKFTIRKVSFATVDEADATTLHNLPSCRKGIAGTKFVLVKASSKIFCGTGAFDVNSSIDFLKNPAKSFNKFSKAWKPTPR